MSNLMMPSRVLLYGRVISGITIDATVFDLGTGGIPGLGNNRFLREQFNDSGYNLSPPPSPALEPCFALIYGFEFEGRYYDLMVPTIMLVHGDGIDHSRGRKIVKATADAAAVTGATAACVAFAAESAADGAGSYETAVAAAAAAAALDGGATAASVASATAEAAAATPYIGRVEKPFPGFADNVRIWPYDKADFSMRLDPCSGPIESILLEAEVDDEELSDEMAGKKVSGKKVGGYRGKKMSGKKVGIRGR